MYALVSWQSWKLKGKLNEKKEKLQNPKKERAMAITW